MRMIVAAFALALAACTPPSTTADAPADSATTAAADSAAAPAAITDAAQLGGMWSFARDCSKSDLVFTNTGATYYDYADPNNVISYDGTFAIAGGNHVELLLHRMDANGSPTGQPLTYNLDLTAPVTVDLAGTFGPAGGAAQTINAKQCAFEAHE